MKREEMIQALADHAYETNDDEGGEMSLIDIMDGHFKHFEAMSNEELIEEWLHTWGEVKKIEED